MNPEEAKARAERAKQLLNDSLLKESFDLAHEAVQQALRVAKTPEESFKATIALQMYYLIKDSISTHIETGKIMEYNFRPSIKERLGF
jgi:D-hexose-6-phosphate mutarotase